MGHTGMRWQLEEMRTTKEVDSTHNRLPSSIGPLYYRLKLGNIKKPARRPNKNKSESDRTPGAMLHILTLTSPTPNPSTLASDRRRLLENDVYIETLKVFPRHLLLNGDALAPCARYTCRVSAFVMVVRKTRRH